MVVAILIIDMQYIQRDEVVQGPVTFGTWNVVFVSGSCSSWWLLDSASELLSGPLELHSGATDTSQTCSGYVQNVPC